MRHFFTTVVSIFLIVFSQYLAKAQLIPEWDRSFGGLATSKLRMVVPTADGGHLLGGSSNSLAFYDKSQQSRGGYDFWILKVDSVGHKQWDRTYGGALDEELAAVLATPDGGFILAGTSKSGISGEKTESSRGFSDFWIVKIDGAGNMVWDKTYGGNSEDYLTSLVLTPDGNFLAGGYSSSNASGEKTENSNESDYWLVKLDTSGNKLWDKTYGGESFDGLTYIVVFSNGSYLLAGNSISGVSGDKTQASRGDQDYWILKIDAEGNKLWDKTYGGNGADILTTAIEATDSGFLLGGYSRSDASGEKSDDSRGIYDYWVIKVSDSGDKLWDKTFGGSGNDQLNSLTSLPNGNYLLAGFSDSYSSGYKTENPKGNDDYWVIKMDEQGNRLWDKTLGGSSADQLQTVVLISKGEYLLAGYSHSNASWDKTQDNKGLYDYWIIKVKEGLEVNPPVVARPPLMIDWDKSLEPVCGSVTSAAPSPGGGYLLGGSSYLKIPPEASQCSNYMIMKIDEKGNKLWNKTLGGTLREDLMAIVPTVDGGFLLGGSSYSNSSGDKTEDRRGGYYSPDYWVVKIDSSGNKLWDKTYGGFGDDFLRTIVPAPGGGFLLAGISDSWTSGEKTENSCYSMDYWAVKIDEVGNMLWDKTYGSYAYDDLRSVAVAADGGYLLGGNSTANVGCDKTENSKGSSDYWVVKIDATGIKEWDRTFGGDYLDGLRSVASMSGGGFVLAGSSLSNASEDKSEDKLGYNDFWIVGIDALGNKLWDRTYGGNSSDDLVEMKATRDGGFILAGRSGGLPAGDKSEDGRGGYDYWVVKIDTAGNKIWDKTAGGNFHDYLTDIITTENRGFLLVGNSRSSVSGDKTQDTEVFDEFWLVKMSTPHVGHVSGGGWFFSPPEAYLPDLTMEGRAIFGFNAKQQEGEEQPEGHVLFNIPTQKFRFFAEEYDWMNINNNKVILKGTGTLNREPGYTFLMSVLDNGKGIRNPQDTYRIIIWNPYGNMVYDNQRGIDIYKDATMPIGGGNITIHKTEERNAGVQEQYTHKYKQPIPQLDGFKAYPTPLGREKGVWLDFPAVGTDRELQITVFDVQGREMASKRFVVDSRESRQWWDLNHHDWPTGIYILTIKGNKLVHQQKLLKQAP